VADTDLLAENPFSTRHTRPGAIPYRFRPGRSLDQLVARFEQVGRTAQIVGDHGAGKSTLLADLIRLWEIQGQRVVLIELHDGQRRLPLRLGDLLNEEPPTLIAVDGYEQLGYWARRTLRRFCSQHGIGLVITTHQSSGLPDLFRCATSAPAAEQIVRHLGAPSDTVQTDHIRQLFHQHHGNIRELLFTLYDHVEHHPPTP